MAVEVAFQVVEEDVLPLTLGVKVAEEYSLEGNRSTVEVEQVVAVGDPLEVLVLMVEEEVVQPYRALRDVEDDEQFDESLYLNLELEGVLKEEHRQTIDEAYLLDLVDFEQLTIFQPRYHAFHLSHRV